MVALVRRGKRKDDVTTSLRGRKRGAAKVRYYKGLGDRIRKVDQAFFAVVHVAPIDKFQQHSSKNSLFPFLI